MGLGAFWRERMTAGRIRVPFAREGLRPDAEIEHLLRDQDQLARRELAGQPPDLDLAAAVWSAERFAQGCRFFIYRELGEEELRRVFAEPCPRPPGPSRAYSVDLGLRGLPDLWRQARQVSAGDPLSDALLELARDWPLSAVGIAEAVPRSLDEIVNHPSLLAEYVDRIFTAQEWARLADPRVREAARSALGAHPNLVAGATAALASEERKS